MIEKIKRTECTGCRACELACPIQCITMETDQEGFLYPVIDDKRCIQCGKCQSICKGKEFLSENIVFEKQVYAARNKDLKVLKNSSSGGIFFALAKYVIDLQGIVYGAAFTSDYLVEQTRIEKAEDIILLMGSKYVQSDTKMTYKQTLRDLKDGRVVLYSGTPCQIKGVINFCDGFTKRLFCVSVICHGVPSPDIWQRYLALKRGQYAERGIQKVSFRDKTYGWKNFNTYIKFEKSKYLEKHETDIYMKGFLQNLFLRPSCYQCMAKKRSVYSDIVIGDYWGIEKEIPEFDTPLGVSSIIINTAKGFELWKGIKNEIYYRKSTYNSVKKYNSVLEMSVPLNRNRSAFFEELKISNVIEEAIKNNLHISKIMEEERFSYQYTILYKYLERELSSYNVQKTLCRLGLRKIVLYSVTDLLDLFVMDISRSKKFTIYISDREYKSYGEKYKGFSVIPPCDLKRMTEKGEVEGIIICNPMRENDIFEDLKVQGLEIDKLYSFVSLIFD